MTRQKTMLTPEMQWERTVAYHLRLFSPCEGISKRGSAVVIFHGTHALANDGDVFILTVMNGMTERFGVTGVSSTGARLRIFHLPLRRGFGVHEIPDDFIGRQWNDPDVGRYVAGLRASFFSQASANSPATTDDHVLRGIDTCQIAFHGVYKSGRLKESTRRYDEREYLRFYPDGSVAMTRDYNFMAWRISFDRTATSPRPTAYGPIGRVIVQGTALKIEFAGADQVWRSSCTGEMRDGRLWLRCEDASNENAHVTLPYRFHPFRDSQ